MPKERMQGPGGRPRDMERVYGRTATAGGRTGAHASAYGRPAKSHARSDGDCTSTGEQAAVGTGGEIRRKGRGQPSEWEQQSKVQKMTPDYDDPQ